MRLTGNEKTQRIVADLDHMSEVLQKKAFNLLTVTKFDHIHFESAIYKRLIVKLAKRLASLFSVDQEVLVLISNFSDQQARTVEFLTSQLDEFYGRVDPSIAIVLHADRSGNNKLKKWGRQRNITIAPIFLGDMEECATEDELERLLCRELYTYDLFDVTGPVSDDAQFFGRRAEATDLARQLQSGQIRSILGIRKLGKTSIVNRVIDQAYLNHACVVVFADCSIDIIWKASPEQLFFALSRSIKAAATGGGRRYTSLAQHLTPTSKPEIGFDLAGLLSSIREANAPVLLFFDEIDYLTPANASAPTWTTGFNPFWRNLRAAYQEGKREGLSLSITVSGVSSRWFTVGEINGMENAALSFIPEDYLSPLARGASVAMIKQIGRGSGLIFNDDAAEVIASYCSDFPFWIRKAGSFIHRNVDLDIRPVKLDLAAVKNHLERFIETEGGILAQTAISHLIKVYPETFEALSSVSAGHYSEIPALMLSALSRYGLIRTKGNQYELSGELIKNGLRLALDAHSQSLRSRSAIPQLETTSTVTLGLDVNEWAEELALINKRRNIIEKRLRDVACNFLRFDCLSKGSSPKERLLKSLKEERRQSLSTLNFEDIFENLYWLELMNILSREWALFEKLFGDKNQMALMGSQLNERPDAHAKTIDMADVALHRKALDWFELKLKA